MKKTIAFILILSMCLSLLPPSVFADAELLGDFVQDEEILSDVVVDGETVLPEDTVLEEIVGDEKIILSSDAGRCYTEDDLRAALENTEQTFVEVFGAVTLTENLTVSGGKQLNMRAALTVPDGVTLRIDNGELIVPDGKRLNLYGRLELCRDGRLRASDGAELHIYENGSVDPAGGILDCGSDSLIYEGASVRRITVPWDGTMETTLSHASRLDSAQLSVEFLIESTEGFQRALETARQYPEYSFTAAVGGDAGLFGTVPSNVKVCIRGNTEIPTGEELILDGSGASFTVPESCLSIHGKLIMNDNSRLELSTPGSVLRIGETGELEAFGINSRITLDADCSAINKGSVKLGNRNRLSLNGGRWEGNRPVFGNEALSFEDLRAALESDEKEIYLTGDIVIDSDLTLPENKRIYFEHGCLSVSDGASLLLGSAELKLSEDGCLRIENGAVLQFTGQGGIVVGQGGSLVCEGTCVSDGRHIFVEADGVGGMEKAKNALVGVDAKMFAFRYKADESGLPKASEIASAYPEYQFEIVFRSDAELYGLLPENADMVASADGVTLRVPAGESLTLCGRLGLNGQENRLLVAGRLIVTGEKSGIGLYGTHCGLYISESGEIEFSDESAWMSVSGESTVVNEGVFRIPRRQQLNLETGAIWTGNTPVTLWENHVKNFSEFKAALSSSERDIFIERIIQINSNINIPAGKQIHIPTNTTLRIAESATVTMTGDALFLLEGGRLIKAGHIAKDAGKHPVSVFCQDGIYNNSPETAFCSALSGFSGMDVNDLVDFRLRAETEERLYEILSGEFPFHLRVDIAGHLTLREGLTAIPKNICIAPEARYGNASLLIPENSLLKVYGILLLSEGTVLAIKGAAVLYENAALEALGGAVCCEGAGKLYNFSDRRGYAYDMDDFKALLSSGEASLRFMRDFTISESISIPNGKTVCIEDVCVTIPESVTVHAENNGVYISENGRLRIDRSGRLELSENSCLLVRNNGCIECADDSCVVQDTDTCRIRVELDAEEKDFSRILAGIIGVDTARVGFEINVLSQEQLRNALALTENHLPYSFTVTIGNNCALSGTIPMNTTLNIAAAASVPANETLTLNRTALKLGEGSGLAVLGAVQLHDAVIDSDGVLEIAQGAELVLKDKSEILIRSNSNLKVSGTVRAFEQSSITLREASVLETSVRGDMELDGADCRLVLEKGSFLANDGRIGLLRSSQVDDKGAILSGKAFDIVRGYLHFDAGDMGIMSIPGIAWDYFTVISEDRLPEVSIIKAGYRFDGWYYDPEYSRPIAGTIPFDSYETKELYAYAKYSDVFAEGEGWRLSTGGTLTIETAEGFEDKAWQSYRDRILYVSVSDFAETISIPYEGFLDFRNLRSFRFEGKIQYIYDRAFMNCTSLAEFDFSRMDIDGAVRPVICYEAFRNSGLVSVVLPDIVIAESSFSECRSLVSVELEGASVMKNLFKDCTALKSVYFGAEKTGIGKGVFGGCNALTALDLTNVSSIDAGAFENCTALASLSAAVGEEKPLKIKNNAFLNCPKLTTVLLAAGSEKEFKGNVEAAGNDVLFRAKYPSPKPVKSVTVSADKTLVYNKNVYLGLGNSTKLTMAYEPKDARLSEAVWTSDNESVAVVCDGLVTAKAEGSAEIRVSLDGVVSEPVRVVVKSYPLRVDSANGSDVEAGGTLALTLAGFDPKTEKESSVIWSLAAGDEQYAKIDTNGKLTALAVTREHHITVMAALKNAQAYAYRDITIYPQVSTYTLMKAVKVGSDYRLEALDGSIMADSKDREGIIVVPIAYPEDSRASFTVPAAGTLMGSEELSIRVGGKEMKAVRLFPNSGKSGKTTVKFAAASGKTSVPLTVQFIDMLWRIGFEETPLELVSGTRNNSAVLKVYELDSDNLPLVTKNGIDSKLLHWSIVDGAEYASLQAAKLTANIVQDAVSVTVRASVIGNEAVYAEKTVQIRPAAANVFVSCENGHDNLNGKTIYVDHALGNSFRLICDVYPEASLNDYDVSVNSKDISYIKEGKIITFTVKETYNAKNPLKTMISFTAKDGSAKKASVTVVIADLVRSISIDRPEITELRSGSRLSLYAATEPAEPTTKGVTWALENSADSAYVTLNANNGQVTAKMVYGAHKVGIYAVSKDSAKVRSKSIYLTILPKNSDSFVVMRDTDSVTNTSLTVDIKETIHLRACKLVGSTAEPEDADWSSSNEKIASVENGIVKIFKAGSFTITAVSRNDAKRKASVSFKAIDFVDRIEIRPDKDADAVVAAGKSITLRAYADGSTKATAAVTWSLDRASGAFAKISSSGVLTAFPDIRAPETITVYAAAKDGSGTMGSLSVQIRPLATGIAISAAGSARTYTTWNVDKSKVAILDLSATVYPADAVQNVTWKSSAARVAAVDSSGTVKLLSTGLATITATTTDGSNKSVSFKLNVSESIVSISFAEKIRFLGSGKSVTLVPTVEPASAKNNVLWKLNGSPALASVSNKGLVKAMNVTEEQTVSVTAYSRNDPSVCAEMLVILRPAVTSIRLFSGNSNVTGKSLKLSQGDTLFISSEILPVNSAQMLAWTAAAGQQEYVTIENVDGGAFITANKTPELARAINVSITAAAVDGSNKTAKLTLNISPRAIN